MKIKQLEWEEDSYGDFEASGFWGIFQVVHAESGEGFTASLNDYNNYEGYEEEDFPTAEEGKAYCQSLLEKQVQAALRFVDGWAGNWADAMDRDLERTPPRFSINPTSDISTREI